MEITANAIQTVQTGSNILFNTTPVGGCGSIMHRDGSGIVTLRGLTTTQDRARFRIMFGANVALPAGVSPVSPIYFDIAINGVCLSQFPTNYGVITDKKEDFYPKDKFFVDIIEIYNVKK